MATRIGPKINLTDCTLYLDAKNPVSYWGVGNTWYDLSGYANHFSLQNSPDWDGNKISFNSIPGSNEYATSVNATVGDFGSSSFTIELVIDLPSAQSPVGYMYLIGNRGRVTFSSTGYSGFSVGIVNQATFKDDGYMINSSTTLFNNPTTDYPLTNQTSYHAYTITRDEVDTTAVTASVYRNANLGRTLNYNVTASSLINGGIVSLMNRESSAYATGSIYSVKFYKRALTRAEIQNNYQIYRNYYNF